MKIIDAKGLIVGRLATYVAKQALLGEEFVIVNCKDAVITGDPKRYLMDIRRMREMGEPFNGPFYPRSADRIMKRSIRGMLPYKKTRGREAFKKIKCYVTVPSNFDGSKAQTLESAHSKNTKSLKLITLERVSASMGINYGREN